MAPIRNETAFSHCERRLVGPGRVERPTSRLSGVRSNHLSYEPVTETEFTKSGIRRSKRARSIERRHAEAARSAPIALRSLTSDSTEEGKRRRRQSLIPEVQNVKIRRSWVTCLLPLSKLGDRKRQRSSLIAVVPLSDFRILRKEVIQPQVPLRLPCYDFTPVADPTVAGCLLAVSAPSSGNANSHGVTGGVYKARERIHRSLLFCDY
jgi:hypothetical protein